MSLKGCAAKPVAFTSSDPDFAVNTDGTIITVHGLEITTKRFSVLVQDENGMDWRVDIILSCNDEVKLQPVILNYINYMICISSMKNVSLYVLASGISKVQQCSSQAH